MTKEHVLFNEPVHTFAKVTTGDFVTTARSSWSSVVGDYDNDGYLDLYVGLATLTAAPATDALYQNDLANGNGWMLLRCEGVVSSRSAIGTRIKAKADLSGVQRWQMREISAQNSGSGMPRSSIHW